MIRNATPITGFIACVFMASATASAAVQTWQITGTVNTVDDAGLLTNNADFAVGDAYDFTITIDTSVAPTHVIGPPGDESADYPALTAMTFNIPTRGLTIINTDGPGEVAINHFINFDDQWRLSVGRLNLNSTIPIVGTDSEGDLSISRVLMHLVVPGDYPSLNPPPMVQPDPTWAPNQFYVEWASSGEGGRYALELSIDSFTLVPEPASAAMLGLAAIGLMGRRRR